MQTPFCRIRLFPISVTCILLFDLKAQLRILLQNVSEVNRERSRLAAASSVCVSTRHNGLVTGVIVNNDLDLDLDPNMSI